jgi:hypothetical protein
LIDEWGFLQIGSGIREPMNRYAALATPARIRISSMQGGANSAGVELLLPSVAGHVTNWSQIVDRVPISKGAWEVSGYFFGLSAFLDAGAVAASPRNSTRSRHRQAIA